MTILDKIIVDKRKEVALKKSIIPVTQLENQYYSIVKQIHWPMP